MNGPTLDPRLQRLLDDYCGAPISVVTEGAGEQGNSGARLRYFRVRTYGGHAQVVVKNATEVERRVASLLHAQGQAVPRSTCSTTTTGRDWLVMEDTEEIPYGDSEVGAWPSRLGVALARIHATNMSRRPDWLPALPSANPLQAAYADEWLGLYEKLVATNAAFRSRYGSLQTALTDSWSSFQAAFARELSEPRQHTVISTDMTPGHWRQRAGEPVFIDWEQARFGPLYLDLPNMFDDTTVPHYYHALRELGVGIPPEEFADTFASLSRYLGFRYLSVGLGFWLGANTLGLDYWESSGARFFEECLRIARVGYPRPDLG